MNTPPYYLSRTTGADLTPLVAPLPYYVGAAIKYLVRAGRKPGTPAVDDLRKAAHCALLVLDNGALEAVLPTALRPATNWCHPHPAALALWIDLRDGMPSAVRQTAHDLLRALDAGEVAP